MLFKPIYNLKNRDKISYKNLSTHCNLNHIFYLIDEIANDLRWDYISMNRKAIDVIYAYKEKVDNPHLGLNRNKAVVPLIELNLKDAYWRFLNSNPNTVHIIKQNPDKIDWKEFSSNSHPDAVELLLKNPDKIDWKEFSSNANPLAINFMRDNLDKIDWSLLCWNETKEAIDLIKENINKLDYNCWGALQNNKYANDLLKDNNKEDWEKISQFSKDVEYLRNNLDKLNWSKLSANSAAISILLENPDKIDYEWFSANTNSIATDKLREKIRTLESCNMSCDWLISWSFMSGESSKLDILFPLKYDKMRENMCEFNQELCMYVFAPTRMERLCKIYKIELEDLQDFY